MLMEMNAAPEPKWSIEFQEYLINELHIKKTDAIFAIGKLHSLMRQYKQYVTEDDLNTISYEAHLTKEAQDIFRKCIFDQPEKPIQYYVELAGIFQGGYKMGYRNAEKNNI